jgi:hypothetical protein
MEEIQENNIRRQERIRQIQEHNQKLQEKVLINEGNLLNTFMRMKKKSPHSNFYKNFNNSPNNTYNYNEGPLVTKEKNPKPIVIVKKESRNYNQIFLYDNRYDINLDQTSNCVGIAQFGKNKYLLYTTYNNKNVSLPCKLQELNTNHLQCNKTNRSFESLTKWTHVLQRYPRLLDQNEWFATNQSGSIQALLGPHFLNVVDYGERRIILMGETHYYDKAQCVSFDITKYDQMKKIENDPFFISRIIEHIAKSTQETIDVYAEAAPKEEELDDFSFVPRITYSQMPKTHQINIPLEEMYTKSLRVHGTDIRFEQI